MHLAQSGMWLEQELEHWLRRNPVQVGLSSLAPGADSLFAEACAKLHIPLIAILPCQGYESAFEAGDLPHYRKLLEGARSHITLSFPSPSQEAFLAAGMHISDHCDVLLAAWNGLPAKGLGGTADIVRHALATQRKVIHFNTLQLTMQSL
jgi:hypothetical protein